MHKVMEFVVFLIGPVEGVRAASVILDYLLTKYDGVVSHARRAQMFKLRQEETPGRV